MNPKTSVTVYLNPRGITVHIHRRLRTHKYLLRRSDFSARRLNLALRQFDAVVEFYPETIARYRLEA